MNIQRDRNGTMKKGASVENGRRQLLQTTGAAVAGVGLVMAGSQVLAAPARRADGAAGDVAVMQGALALEHEGIAAYRIAAGSGLLSQGTIAVASIFLGHHEGHRDALAKLIMQAGGKPAEPKSDQDYITALNIGALKSEADVVKFAAGLEQGAANAYVGQVSALREAKLAHLFSQLGTDEAVHWALLNNAAGGGLSKAAFLFG
jgi:hypothetical protein